MKRYILRFRGTGPKPDAAVERLRTCANLKVLDASANRMVLVETQPDTIATLRAQMPDWQISEETFTPLPDTRARVK